MFRYRATALFKRIEFHTKSNEVLFIVRARPYATGPVVFSLSAFFLTGIFFKDSASSIYYFFKQLGNILSSVIFFNIYSK